MVAALDLADSSRLQKLDMVLSRCVEHACWQAQIVVAQCTISLLQACRSFPDLGTHNLRVKIPKDGDLAKIRGMFSDFVDQNLKLYLMGRVVAVPALCPQKLVCSAGALCIARRDNAGESDDDNIKRQLLVAPASHFGKRTCMGGARFA